MKRIKYLILSIALACTVQANAQKNLWARSAGGTGNDRSNGVTVDNQNNVITTGFFSGTVDFDPSNATFNLTSAGATDIFVQKLAANGDFVWAVRLGNTGNDAGHSVTTLENGDIIITGFFSGTVDFDPGIGVFNLSSGGNNDAFICRLSANGTFITAIKLGSVGLDQGLSVITDQQDNYYVTGLFLGTVNFNPQGTTFNLVSTSQIAAFIVSYTSSGSLRWGFTYTTSSRTQGNALALDNLGNIYIAGNAGPSGFVMRRNATTGVLNWVRTFTGVGTRQCLGVDVDPNGAVYASGSFSSVMDFDPSGAIVNVNANGGTDGFIVKLDQNGNYIWGDKVGNSGNDIATNVRFDSSSHCYLTGSLSNPSTPNSSDYFINKYTTNGTLLKSHVTSTVETATITSIVFDKNNKAVIAGEFSAPSNSNRNLYGRKSQGGTDIFAAQYVDCNIDNIALEFTSCGPITIGNVYYTTSGIYSQTYQNQSGCDSIVTFQLTINAPSHQNLFFRNCGPISINNNTYMRSGIYVDSLKSITGCDSVLSYNIQINTTHSINIDTTVCDVYSLNNVSYDKTGTYIQRFKTTTGCDSIITIQVTVNQSTSDSIAISGCQSVSYNNITYTSSGLYTQTTLNATGCAHTTSLWITISNPTIKFIDSTVCEVLNFNGVDYAKSGIYPIASKGNNGCIDTTYLQLTVLQPVVNAITVNACDTFTLNNIIYKKSGQYTQQFMAANGCDSILQLNLTINESSITSEEITVCDKYINGNVELTNSGVYSFIYKTTLGCDSIVYVYLTVLNSSSNRIALNSCKPITVNGMTYNRSGIYKQLLQNSAGCDSNLTVVITILPSDTVLLNQSVCGSYQLANNTFTKTGIYHVVFTNQSGCDSVVVLNLVVRNNTSASISRSGCGNVRINGITYTMSGVYTQNLTNAAGCDSILTCTVTILPVSHTVSIGTTISGAIAPNTIYLGYGPQTASFRANIVGTGGPFTIQWIGTGINNTTSNSITFSPTTSGRYTIEIRVTNANGCVVSQTVEICVFDARNSTRNNQVIICKVPPGNPAAAHTISVGAPAVPAHLRTGSTLGPCGINCQTLVARKAENNEELPQVFGLTNSEITYKAYPNPFEDALMIIVESAITDLKVQLRLMDISGKIVWVGDAQVNVEKQIDAMLAKGVYMLELTSDTETKYIKVVKK